MTNFLEKVRNRLKFLDAKWFDWLVGATMFLNPIALTPQLVRVIISPSVEGLSISSFILFAFIQLAFVAVGIQKMDWRMFLAMGISFIETVVIIVTIVVR